MIMRDIEKLCQANCPKLSRYNKELNKKYREYTQIIKKIYDLAQTILDDVLGPNYSLPIDVRAIAEKLGFIISNEGFDDTIEQYLNAGHDCTPIAQLIMREKRFGVDSDKICGKIKVDSRLNINSVRFFIAHELGHFVLRENKVGSYLALEACPGLYPLVDTSELLADIFAYALLLPYHLFEKERVIYENNRLHWPLDYSEWIEYIRNKAMIPEYHAVLACQEIKRISIYLKQEAAKTKLFDMLCKLGIFNPEEQEQALKLYAITINNLEAWGFLPRQIADICFASIIIENTNDGEKISCSDLIAFMQDLYINNNGNLNDRYHSKVIEQIVIQLSEGFDISVEGISKITELPIDSIRNIITMRTLR